MSISICRLRAATSLFVALGALTASRTASAEIVGIVDVIDRGAISGWALDTTTGTSLDVAIWLQTIDGNGVVSAPVQAISRTVKADLSRPDLASFGQGVNHGFSSSLNYLNDGAYLINPIAIDPTNGNKASLGEFRVVRRISDAPRTDFWLQYKGPVGGLVRNNDYESYPTVMIENGQYKMWYCGGPGDKIFYATSPKPFDGWTVQNGGAPVMAEGATGLDSSLICDPSVVRPPGSPYYFMQYTAVGKAGAFGAKNTLNRAFEAISSDGINWAKMDNRTKTFTDTPWPILWSKNETANPGDVGVGYGTGQTSVIFDSLVFLKGAGAGSGFITYFTDSTVNGVGIASSDNGGWDYTKHFAPVPQQPGDYTWDFKRHAPTGRTIGMVARFGEFKPGSTVLRAGSIGITVSADGLNFTDSGKLSVPMVQLTADDKHQSINNGGLVGNELGVIPGDNTAFYFGAGWGTNDDPNFLGVWPPLQWDISAVDVKVHDCGQGIPGDPCGIPGVTPADSGVVMIPGEDGGVYIPDGDGGYVLLEGGTGPSTGDDDDDSPSSAVDGGNGSRADGGSGGLAADGGDESGCSCRTSIASPINVGAMIGALGAALALARRRSKRG